MKHGKREDSTRKTNKQLIVHQERETTGLNKYISDSGFCSRRAANRLIEDGRVKVDGVVAVLGVKVSQGQEVCVGGNLINPKKKKVYIALNKPAGIVSTTDVLIPRNLTTFMNCNFFVD